MIAQYVILLCVTCRCLSNKFSWCGSWWYIGRCYNHIHTWWAKNF